MSTATEFMASPWAGHKLSRGAHASLVSAKGLVYFTVDDGTTYIIRPGKELDIAISSSLPGRMM